LNGEFVGAWDRQGSGPGQFVLPYRVVEDATGLVYVTDKENNRVQVIAPA
jgi:hypothetical protein